jgi:hypothetical protein
LAYDFMINAIDADINQLQSAWCQFQPYI